MTARYLILGATLALGACMGSGGSGPQTGFTAPPPPGAAMVAAGVGDPMLVAAPQPLAQTANAGAIFQVGNGYSGLVTGTRARMLGDMVTIILTENTITTKSTAGQTNRSGSFGITPPASGPLDFLNPDALKAAAEGSFSGGGNAAQQSRLNGAVAVTIAAIYPNGTAEVVGEKQMMFSQGEEWVQFAGRIRLIDIDGDNRLSSAQVANARIIYSGRGAVQQASRPGWLSRFFNKISPF
ncbi:flagellar basal body L-ring protein FlgH [Erythrobacter sanguineus]|jgi:flagellar L-ring protein precursor FlgH|uniref:Flagellar L-ring protein n=1 Tax=Erythrobacter sanguineus TaxID=198312 RepID=A0A1M7SF00_9SPHN|nr:flagellar basal body L-ring protein FlgH [Erythrobacter sanguineus]MCR9179074.1 flagellar basal body L-ring protein FlgH [Erythrobacteraceae bacterium]SHN57081.1 flagellar L-ring protein precursor FlgH [Erythrobacter sanguineus]